MVNIDQTSAIFAKGGNLIDLINEFLGNKSNESYQNSNRVGYRNYERDYQNNGTQSILNNWYKLNKKDLETLNKEFENLEFQVNHLDSKLKFTIFKLTSKTISEIELDYNGKKCSVKEYFEDKYSDYVKNK